MTVEEIVQQVNSLHMQILTSDEMGIQRDLNDDPFEPVDINILGIMYHFVSAEVTAQHDYHIGEDETESCDIIINVQRDDDIGAYGDADEQQFTVDIVWLKEYAEKLSTYLHSYDEENKEEKEEGLYPLTKKYFEIANTYYHSDFEKYAMYKEIARELDKNKDNVKDAIIELRSIIQHAERLKLAVQILEEEQSK